MISASHEGCRGIFPLYTPITLHIRDVESISQSRRQELRDVENILQSQRKLRYIVRTMCLPWSIVLKSNCW